MQALPHPSRVSLARAGSLFRPLLPRLRETAQQLTVAAGLRGKNEQSRGSDHAL